MNRRALLRAGGAAAFGVIAGCAGSATPDDGTDASLPSAPTQEDERSPPSAGSFEATGWDYNAGASGPLVVTVTVRNTRSAGEETSAPATLTVTVETDEREERQSATVAVPPGETETYELTFETTVETFEAGGRLSFGISAA